ncbi:hypothetical protein GAYE_HTGSCF06PCTG21G0318 [Galdieria yellowstonensis]|uniref:CbbX AAA lid domain-containing protein n=1 Tax=Galdieria yellowstonensis TaxID=3028027 RepID=A0AAV9I2R1_9RHOD|nr:hypothetical protein GAYE_HTGSCF06PCTG21G0318 [Galdieria yellowstonensis]
MQSETGTAAEEVLGEDLRKRMAMSYFSNAPTFRNAVDRARLRAAEKHLGLVSRRKLRILEPEDFVSAKELEANAIVE